MAGTKIGSVKAVNTIYAKFGSDYFRVIGAKGDRAGHTGGFYGNPMLASAAGALGGRLSRRGYKLSDEERHRIRLEYKREYAKAYEELLAIHTKAKKQREAYSYA
jgi:hypothetical protein